MTQNTSLVDTVTTWLDLSSYAALSTQSLSSLVCANGYGNTGITIVGGGGGGGGGTGNYTYTSSGTSWTNPFESSNDKINKRLDAIEARLSILRPSFEKHEKFAALKRAYDHYKVVEALCIEQQET